MVICLEQGADLHMAQLMPLSLTVSCFSIIQIGFIFLVPAHPGSPGKRAVKRVCVFSLDFPQHMCKQICPSVACEGDRRRGVGSVASRLVCVGLTVDELRQLYHQCLYHPHTRTLPSSHVPPLT